MLKPYDDPSNSVFGGLDSMPADSLLALIAMFNKDPKPGKLDLGVGVFRDERGQTPIMRAVKGAENRLLSQQATKAYLGAEGDVEYLDALARIALGDQLALSNRLTGLQTPGGTGALRLGAELISRALPDATVWIGTPTWPNHAPIFREAGLQIKTHRFFDSATSKVDFDGMMLDLARARAGDVVLLHGCCHNPTGAEMTPSQWQEIATLCAKHGLVPFIDLAYQGLGEGLEKDAAAVRMMVGTVPDSLIAYSCDKNFGLYRDRVGALWVQSANSTALELARSNMLMLSRVLWSMPPDHGAAVVRLILQDDVLRWDWADELAAMRDRINSLRDALAGCHPRLDPIGSQRGMFAMLPLTTDQVLALRKDHGIYMAGNGRINIAGLTLEKVPAFVGALDPYLNE